MLSRYNFTLVYYAANITGTDGKAPLFGFGFAVNGKVSRTSTFVDNAGAPMPIVTIASVPQNTTSWTWLPQEEEVKYDEKISQRSYAFPNAWIKAGP
ncbi:MAG: hypothetical protein ABWK05_03075 [Pyrobaculum sp.]